MHYELKNTSRGNASVPRGAAHYLCTYLLTFVSTIKRNQSEPIGTSPNHSVFILIHQSSILMKIRANHSGNFWFEWKSISARTEPFSFSFTCTFRTIFYLNVNQSSIKLPNNFWFEWKSEHWLLRSYNVFNAGRLRKESASTQE